MATDITETVPPKFVRIPVAAEMIGVSVCTIRRLIETKKLTPYRPVRGRVVLSVDELTAHVESSVYTPRKGRGIKQA